MREPYSRNCAVVEIDADGEGSGNMKRRQFIAGAVCPSCQQMDRIVIEQENDQPVRRCVACGFRDDTLPGSGVLPPTRFTRASGPARDQQASAPAKIRILDNPPDRSSREED